MPRFRGYGYFRLIVGDRRSKVTVGPAGGEDEIFGRRSVGALHRAVAGIGGVLANASGRFASDDGRVGDVAEERPVVNTMAGLGLERLGGPGADLPVRDQGIGSAVDDRELC